MLLFNNLAFLFFLAIVVFVYFIVPKRFQWIVLLVSSFGFYLSFSYKFATFIVATIITIYFAAMYFFRVNNNQKFYLLMNPNLTADEKKAYKNKCKRKKKCVFILTILINIGILFVLKYLNFLGDSFNGIIGWFGGSLQMPHLNLILPLGISFYTFQSVGYLIDCYWGKISYEENIFKFALFVSFFPQIIQGPISRFNELQPQLLEGHKFNYDKFVAGTQRIVWGLFKKLIIADTISMFVSTVFSNSGSLSGFLNVAGVLCYLIQDYADFSGCIDIAMGSAECMGINLPDNFNRPYFSLSIPEYWRRWHITLGTWFKDYIFYPISISKFSLKLGKFSKKLFGPSGKNVPAIFGLMVVWLTTGLWHGASWNYVLWGAYYGIIIIMGVILQPLFDYLIKKLHINQKAIWWKIFSWIRTIWLLCVGRIIFRASSIGSAWTMFAKTFEIFSFKWDFANLGKKGVGGNDFVVFVIGAIILLVVDLIKERKPEVSIREKIRRSKTYISWPIYIILIICIVVFGAYGLSYNPADFIYMQF